MGLRSFFGGSGTTSGLGLLGVRSELQGGAAAMLSLARLRESTQRAVLRPAVTKCGRILAKAVKDDVPRDSGLLAKSIGYVVRTYAARNVVLTIAGTRRGFRQQVFFTPKSRTRLLGKARASRMSAHRLAMFQVRDPVKYLHILVGGRQPINAGTAKGKGTGKKVLAGPLRVYGRRVAGMTGKPILTRAVDRTRAQCIGIINNEIRAGIQKAAARNARNKTR